MNLISKTRKSKNLKTKQDEKKGRKLYISREKEDNILFFAIFVTIIPLYSEHKRNISI